MENIYAYTLRIWFLLSHWWIHKVQQKNRQKYTGAIAGTEQVNHRSCSTEVYVRLDRGLGHRASEDFVVTT